MKKPKPKKRIRQKQIFLSFEEARVYAHSLNFRRVKEWQSWAKTKARPKDIPANPSTYYKDKWEGWMDFL